MDDRSDESLIDAVNAGDAGAFAALYGRHRDHVVRLARRFTGDDADALDVLQETFAYLLRKVPGLRLTARMTTFLYPVVRHLSIAVRRKRTRALGRGGGGGGDDADLLALLPAPAAADRGAGELAAVLADLPAGQREVLLMRFVDGFSLEEIAQAIGIPVGTVKSRIHNALRSLQDDPRAREYFAEESGARG